MNWMGGKRSRAKATGEERLKQRQFFERQRRIRAHKMYSRGVPVSAVSGSSSWPARGSTHGGDGRGGSAAAFGIPSTGCPPPPLSHDRTTVNKTMPKVGTEAYDALRVECLERLRTKLDWRGKAYTLLPHHRATVSWSYQVEGHNSTATTSGDGDGGGGDNGGEGSSSMNTDVQGKYLRHHHHHYHRPHHQHHQAHQYHENGDNETLSPLRHHHEIAFSPVERVRLRWETPGPEEKEEEDASMRFGYYENGKHPDRSPADPDEDGLLQGRDRDDQSQGAYAGVEETSEFHSVKKEEDEGEEDEGEENEADQKNHSQALVVVQKHFAERLTDVNHLETEEHGDNNDSNHNDYTNTGGALILEPRDTVIHQAHPLSNKDDDGDDDDDEPLMIPTRHIINCARANRRRSSGLAKVLSSQHNQDFVVPQTFIPAEQPIEVREDLPLMQQEQQQQQAIAGSQPSGGQRHLESSVTNNHSNNHIHVEARQEGRDMKFEMSEAYLQGVVVVARSDTDVSLPLFSQDFLLSPTDHDPLHVREKTKTTWDVSDQTVGHEGDDDSPGQWEVDSMVYSLTVKEDKDNHHRLAPTVTGSRSISSSSSTPCSSAFRWTWEGEGEGDDGSKEEEVVAAPAAYDAMFPKYSDKCKTSHSSSSSSSSSMAFPMKEWPEGVVQAAALSRVERMEGEDPISERGSMNTASQWAFGMQEASSVHEEEDVQGHKGQQDQGQQQHQQQQQQQQKRSNSVDALLLSVCREDKFLRELDESSLGRRPKACLDGGALEMGYPITEIDINNDNNSNADDNNGVVEDNDTFTTILGDPSDCLETSDLCTVDYQMPASPAGPSMMHLYCAAAATDGEDAGSEEVRHVSPSTPPVVSTRVAMMLTSPTTRSNHSHHHWTASQFRGEEREQRVLCFGDYYGHRGGTYGRVTARSFTGSSVEEEEEEEEEVEDRVSIQSEDWLEIGSLSATPEF
ncbi:hypothetical protein DFQ27_000988 [Actinomortierella ambigua]|uniref:Uncharacterized protein n=1 Tax=Actinomortierella ambigua TaxID=1343610 RepID=A0A9P6QK55_9FUNG|nr:hypothetical protein DFQ27_000988 [Actinomortierella ambigua]